MPASTGLSDSDRLDMTVSAWEQAKTALEAGDTARAAELIDIAAERSASLRDYSINWICSLLSFVADELGEPAVERALRRTGEEYVRPRRDTGVEWASLPAEVRARAIARAMVANGGECGIEESADEITLSFRCGTGGRLIDEGAYEPDGTYRILREPAARTFGRDELPVYCAHCSVNNEMQAIEWTGTPTTVEEPPARAGEPCVHHIYRDAAAVPEELLERVRETGES